MVKSGLFHSDSLKISFPWICMGISQSELYIIKTHYSPEILIKYDN